MKPGTWFRVSFPRRPNPIIDSWSKSPISIKELKIENHSTENENEKISDYNSKNINTVNLIGFFKNSYIICMYFT